MMPRDSKSTLVDPKWFHKFLLTFWSRPFPNFLTPYPIKGDGIIYGQHLILQYIGDIKLAPNCASTA